MSKYRELILLPKLEVKENANEVIFTLISCMCDNISYLRFKKNDNNEFKIRHYNNHAPLSFTNLQCKYPQHEIEWEADNQNWGFVIDMINSGTSLISEVKSR